MDQHYDIVAMGAGHNGLVAAADLASADAQGAFKPLPALAHCAGKGGSTAR